MKLPLQVQSWSWIHNGLLLLASASAWSGEPLTSAVFGPPITYSNRVGDSWVNTWADDDCIYSITDDCTTSDNQSANVSIACLSGDRPDSLSWRTVNAMSEYGKNAQVFGPENYCWKGNSILCVDGVLYVSVSRHDYPFRRGAIWYQGESNGHSEEQSRRYATQLPMLINDWRGRWSLGDFPFAWVQLPNYNTSARSWPSLRESMRASLAVPNTGMVVAIDLGSTNTIHPVDKQNVGVRLSLWARAKVYGEQIGWSGPLLSGHTVKGAEIELRFTHCDGGLVARNGELRGFEVAAADKQWRPASARINQDMVLVSSPEVKAPVAVRYAWHFNPDGNLFNRAGLPASPFRTQDWAD